MTDRAAKTARTTKTTQTDTPDHDRPAQDSPELATPELDTSAQDADLIIRASDTAFARDADSPGTEVARPDETPTPAAHRPPGSASHLQQIASAVLAPLGYELLEVQVQNPGRRPVVVVRIDRADEQPVSIEDLAASSRAVGAEYDRLDPIQGEYRLELESPGAKRPLLRARHFERMLGLKAKVRGDGHSFTAPITAVVGEDVTFGTPEGDVTLRIGQFQANLAEFPSEHR